MKKAWVILAAAMILFSSTTAFAQSSGSIVWQDALYGTVTGALVGAAFLAFQDDPEDHFDYIYRGAAVGAIAGLLFGVYEVTAFATFDNEGNIRFALPTIKTSVVGGVEREIEASVDIIKINF